MRLAYVCMDPGVPVYGHKGCSVHAQEMLRALRKQGIAVELFVVNLGGDSPPGFEDIVVHPLPCPRGARADREQAALANNDRLHALLDQFGPYDMVYERHALWSYAAMENAVVSGTPALLEINAPLVDEQARHRGLVDRLGAERAAARAFRAADHMLAVSRAVADYLRKAGADSKRIHVIPNGVDVNRFAPGSSQADLNIDAHFVVGFVGSLKPWHGLEVLAEAYARLIRRHADMALLIVGDGPQRAALERQLEATQCRSRAHFTGAVAPGAVPGLIARMDVAVAPYPALDDFYFSPLKVYEYMAAARPVVASRIGQLQEVIEDGVNGLLCPPGDALALSEAISRLHRDPALCQKLGQSARETVVRNHSWNRIAQRVIDLARDVATRPRGRFHCDARMH